MLKHSYKQRYLLDIWRFRCLFLY